MSLPVRKQPFTTSQTMSLILSILKCGDACEMSAGAPDVRDSILQEREGDSERQRERAWFPGLGENNGINFWPKEEQKAQLLGAQAQPSGFPGSFPVLKCIGCESAVPSKQGALCPSSLASFPAQDPDDWQSTVNDKPSK